MKIMKTSWVKKGCIVLLLLAVMVCLSATVALASEGGDLPWNTGLDKLTKALSGKLALFISMIGVFFAGGMLMFGGDLGNFGKSIMMVVLIGSILGGLAQVVSAFVTTGALLL